MTLKKMSCINGCMVISNLFSNLSSDLVESQFYVCLIWALGSWSCDIDSPIP